jgi:hypothetical protein
MEITPSVLASQGITGNLVLVAKNYIIIDVTAYEGRKAKNGKHRLIAYCRECFRWLASASHALAHKAFEYIEQLVGKICRHCAQRAGAARVKSHRGTNHTSSNGCVQKHCNPSIGIG